MDFKNVTYLSSFKIDGKDRKCGVMHLTKKDAKEILDRPTTGFVNRSTQKRAIGLYKEQMNAGNWNAANCEQLGFDVLGNLINGRNRLAAFVESNLEELDFFVTFDHDTEDAQTIDRGLKRSTENMLQMRGVNFSKGIITSVRMYLSLVKRYSTWGQSERNTHITQDMQTDVYMENQELFEKAYACGTDTQNHVTEFKKAQVAGVFAYLVKEGVSEKKVREFFKYIWNHPNKAFKDELADRNKQVGAWISMWNAWCDGKKNRNGYRPGDWFNVAV